MSSQLRQNSGHGGCKQTMGLRPDAHGDSFLGRRALENIGLSVVTIQESRDLKVTHLQVLNQFS